MPPLTPSDVAQRLSAHPYLTAEPGEGEVLIRQLNGAGRTVRLDMARAIDACASGPGALVALAERLVFSDWRAEWEELWRMLATTKDAVPVQLARRCAVLAAMRTRADCADLVWRMGTDLPVYHHERPALCEAGLSIGRLALPTDEAPCTPSEGA
ncbi:MULTISPECIES: hypothetical protein [Myxococcus]|uniref:hypothetical protein n=1 Tax=Myxococcus TaxID=32 RepID=UPI0011449D63|nr:MULTISPECIES: hypothetical protein [Myxococcus]NOK05815.1 hypothetical protein [Myxococcus xanthus]